MHVLRNELLRLLHSVGRRAVQEVDKFGRFIQLGEKEIHAARLLLDVEHVAMGAVLEDELLEVEHGPLVEDLLANLN